MTSPSATMLRVRARVLGGWEVQVRGRRLTRSDWRRTAAERLVKLLLVTPGHRVSREVAAEALWPGGSPASLSANLRKAIHFARRALAPDDLIVTDNGLVCLDGSRLDVDLDRLEASLAAISGEAAMSRPIPDREAADRPGPIDEVLALGALELLPDDQYEDWLAAPRERLRSRWQHVALAAARLLRDAGRREDAHALVDRLLVLDPTDEAAHRLAIELYAAAGRHHAARRQFELCRAAMRDQLDSEPSTETCETLAAVERLASTKEPGVPVEGPLIGREAEREAIEAVLDRVASGTHAALVVRGPAGIGKSRFLREVVSVARASGWQVVEWQPVESVRGSAYTALRAGLSRIVVAADLATWNEPARSAVATVIEGLSISRKLTFAGRSALVAGLVEALELIARERPLLFAWDDLPWVDAASIETIGAACAAATDAGILVAATLRDDEPIPKSVESFIDLARRTAGAEVVLQPLGEAELEPLIVTHLGGESVQPELLAELFERSAGNPLFCLELARVGRDHGTILVEHGRWTRRSVAGTEEVPDTVRRLVARRLAGLGPGAADVLATAAELPAQIPFDLLTAAMPGSRGEVIAGLDEALACGLLVERTSGYAFAHPLYRAALQGVAGSARRGRVRLAIARAMAGVCADDPPGRLAAAAQRSTDPIRVADYALSALELGASEGAALAVAVGFAAAARQQRLFDSDNAARTLEHALAAWARLPAEVASQFDASGAWTRLGDLRATGGDEEAGVRALREAIAVARDPGDVAAAYVSWYWIPYRHGDFQGGLAILEEALEVLPPDAALARATIEREIGWSLIRCRRVDEAVETLRGSLAVFEAAGDEIGQMRVFDYLGTVAWAAGRIDESVTLLERSLGLALKLGDVAFETVARIHLISTLGAAGRFALARRHAERSLELSRLRGDRYDESVAAWLAAEMEDMAGNAAAAVELRRRQLRLLDELGGNPRNEAWAHAHLSVIAREAGDVGAARAEAAIARRLARLSPELDDPDLIERALAVRRWSEAGLS